MLHNRRKLKHSSRHRIQGTAHQWCNATLIGLPTVNTYSTDRIVKQTTSTGETWKMAYKRSGACVAKVLPAPVINGASTQTWEYTCRAGQPLSSRICAGGTCTQSGTESLAGICPDTDSDESRLAGWRFYGGANLQTSVTYPDGNTSQHKFNALGQGAEDIDELGQSTKYLYDAKQRMVKSIDCYRRPKTDPLKAIAPI